MKNYNTYPKLDLIDIAKTVTDFWQRHQIFEKSVYQRQNGAHFTFFEGPPSANGAPGIHHVLAMTIKDLVIRYKTMQGHHVTRKSGWDTHGLPVELKVEKDLGISKDDIGTVISVVDYNRRCKEMVMAYKSQWESINQAIGYWKDNTDPYITYDQKYIESVWYLLKVLHNKQLIYKGYSIQPYSPMAGTGLSSHELNQPGCYKLVKDLAAFVQFKLVGRRDEYFLAWTTTPWTLPANSALAINPDAIYARVKTTNPYTGQVVKLILAKERLEEVFSDHQQDWDVLEHVEGHRLVGLHYEQLMPYVKPQGDAFRVIAGDFVTTTEGTGIIHIAPTFGADDYRVAQKEGITSILVTDQDGNKGPIVDRKGRFVAEIVDFAGLYVKEAYGKGAGKAVDQLIIDQLKRENRIFKANVYEHSYPHCWRTNTPILYYPLNAWFIKTTAYKELLVDLNQSIIWHPGFVGKGRFSKWLENLVDWNLSRERYWGTPLPIWRTADQLEEKCIGSIGELKLEVQHAISAGLMQEPIADDIDLHRPWVDDIVLVSSKGLPMYREPSVIDVWFDSGAMPYAQWHYPFENHDAFIKNFPADFIAEGIDQTRGWFFTLHVLSGLLLGIPAFKHVVVNGLVLDQNGNKMSKNLGNVLDPHKLLEQYGPDAIRWYMIGNNDPWENLKFDESGIQEVIRKFFMTLHNTYTFFAIYANIDRFFVICDDLSCDDMHVCDAWITSRCQSLVSSVIESYENYSPTPAARAIQDFVVNDLSNWYVRLNRKRFWKNSYDNDKRSAYQVLYRCLVTSAKLMAPIAPFYADFLYRSLNVITDHELSDSVHLSDFPVVEEKYIDQALEEQMRRAQVIVSLVHSLRKKHRLKVRQPLAHMTIVESDSVNAASLAPLEELIKAETNVKAIGYVDNTNGLVQKKVKPNFAILGKKYGKKMDAISRVLALLGQEEIRQLEERNSLELSVDNEVIAITSTDVLVIAEDIPGYYTAVDGDVTIALDTTLTKALKQEGLVREFIHAIQRYRKSQGFAVEDKIHLKLQEDNIHFSHAILAYKDFICTETQALSLEFVDALQHGQAIDVDGTVVTLAISRVGH